MAAKENWVDCDPGDPEILHVNTPDASDWNTLGAEINNLTSDVPRFLPFSTTWPARPNDNRVAFFVGGASPDDAPIDANLRNNDVWMPSTGESVVHVRTGGAWPFATTPPPPDPGLPPLWNASPPAGVCSAPSGPNSGIVGQFDYAVLAQNEIWDHFDGTAGSNPDSRLWLEDNINQGGTQTYDPANMFLDGNGKVVLRATQSGGVVRSGRFTSRTKFNMKYGWLAARIKFANSTGTVGRSWFPAFWILHVPFNGGVYGEVDIMEIFGDSTWYSSHLYPDTASLQSQIRVPANQGSNCALGYHTYWLMWESDRIRIGVDDLQMGDWTSADLTGGQSWAGMDLPHYFILNFAVHPSYLPAPLPSDFPADMLVDWIWYKPLSLLAAESRLPNSLPFGLAP